MEILAPRKMDNNIYQEREYYRIFVVSIDDLELHSAMAVAQESFIKSDRQLMGIQVFEITSFWGFFCYCINFCVAQIEEGWNESGKSSRVFSLEQKRGHTALNL